MLVVGLHTLFSLWKTYISVRIVYGSYMDLTLLIFIILLQSSALNVHAPAMVGVVLLSDVLPDVLYCMSIVLDAIIDDTVDVIVDMVVGSVVDVDILGDDIMVVAVVELCMVVDAIVGVVIGADVGVVGVVGVVGGMVGGVPSQGKSCSFDEIQDIHAAHANTRQ